MDTKTYEANNWHVSYCTEHNERPLVQVVSPSDSPMHGEAITLQDGTRWAYSGGLWWRNAPLDLRAKDEEEAATRIVHAPSYSCSSDGPTTCDCGVYQVWDKTTHLWLVGKDGEIAHEISNKIMNGPKGSINKYLVVYTGKNIYDYDRARWNIISLGRFTDHGVFTSEEQALEFSNDMLYRKIGKLQEKIIMNLNRLIQVRQENA